MTEFSRAGHWRTLFDGTRTWVTAHRVDREPVAKHAEHSDVFKRRADERATIQQAMNDCIQAALNADNERAAALDAKKHLKAAQRVAKATQALALGITIEKKPSKQEKKAMRLKENSSKKAITNARQEKEKALETKARRALMRERRLAVLSANSRN